MESCHVEVFSRGGFTTLSFCYTVGYVELGVVSGGGFVPWEFCHVRVCPDLITDKVILHAVKRVTIFLNPKGEFVRRLRICPKTQSLQGL